MASDGFGTGRKKGVALGYACPKTTMAHSLPAGRCLQGNLITCSVWGVHDFLVSILHIVHDARITIFVHIKS